MISYTVGLSKRMTFQADKGVVSFLVSGTLHMMSVQFTARGKLYELDINDAYFLDATNQKGEAVPMSCWIERGEDSITLMCRTG